jgi:hypothetical protein
MRHRIVAALTAACLSLPAHASDISVVAADWQDDKTVVTVKLDGWIEAGDMERILKAYRIARKKGLTVVGLEMHSTGGDVGTGIAIANFVRKSGRVVILRSECWSSCGYAALVALAKRRLKVGDHAEIGIHQTFDTASGVPSPEWDNQVIDLFKRSGVAPRAIVAMQTTTMNSMTYYDLIELRKMGARELGSRVPSEGG